MKHALVVLLGKVPQSVPLFCIVRDDDEGIYLGYGLR